MAMFYGVEVKVEQDLFTLAEGDVGISGRYDFVRAEFDGGGNVPRIPPQRLGGGMYWRGENFQAAVTYLHAFNQNDLGQNETPTKGFDLLNALVGYTARIDQYRAATLSIVGTNLLDRDMRNAASFKKDEVVLPGRSVRFVATISF